MMPVTQHSKVKGLLITSLRAEWYRNMNVPRSVVTTLVLNDQQNYDVILSTPWRRRIVKRADVVVSKINTDIPRFRLSYSNEVQEV